MIKAILTLHIWIAAGLAVSLALFYEAFVSVWCFFAAVASGMIFLRQIVLRSVSRIVQTAPQAPAL